MTDGDGSETADGGGSSTGDPEGDERAAGPAGEGETGEGDTAGTAPVAFLAGGLLVLGSAAAFVADLVTGHGVGRSVALNAAGALVLVAWAARDTLSNPTASVDSLPGAVGTALLVYGGYLVVAALVVAATGVRHGRPGLAAPLGVAGVLAVIIGVLTFLAAVGGGRDGTGREGGDGDGAGAGGRSGRDGGG